MPAHRSRTERWKDCLHQIYERNGGLEFSLAQNQSDSKHIPDLMWRVRVLAIGERELLLESPTAAGRPIPIDAGQDVVVVMSVGQNRWMFRSRTLGIADGPTPFGRMIGLRLKLPENVERCTRREFLRTSTAELTVPTVHCWRLLDIPSAAAAEAATRVRANSTGELAIAEEASPDTDVSLPNVGPSFSAKLINIGGGGVGLLVDRADASAADKSRALWLRVDLRPTIKTPIAMCARVVHTHLDSAQNLYLGASFDFSHGTAHRDFVVEQITRFVNHVQSRRKAA